MSRWPAGLIVLGSSFLVACGGSRAPESASSPAGPYQSPAEMVAADRGLARYTPADVHFMSGMIPHHAQAVLIAGWAATHDAGIAVRTLCERIVVAQKDEIATMQRWLEERGHPVPAADATHLRMTMNGVEHDMLMPGMLDAQALAQLDRSRGVAFDRLFLIAMIRHHEGAVTMVDQLFSSSGGAGQDETVFRLASDIYADQTTEIDRMQTMLAALPGGTPP